ncbi:MAG: amino acid permease [Marinicaulis sp.]|nr:amino acid permease [Marinicaulis sp.]
MTETAAGKPIGFWRCWSFTVGVMIGSGVFLLPAVLAPFGSISFLGWLFTSIGAVVVSLVLGGLARQTTASGGFYVYTREAFGGLPGFVVAWSYWLSIVFATAAIASAFAGYAGSVVPYFAGNSIAQAVLAAAIIWVLTAVNLKGIAEASLLQLIMTVLKIIPLFVIIALGVAVGTPEYIPTYNPKELSLFEGVATTALLTMWAFVGLEAGTVPAEDVVDAKRTVPRAIVFGTVCVAAIYIASTAAVMMLVPVDQLARSEAPFFDAARALGPVGGPLIAIGALVSTAGSLNGNIFLGGQMPMSVARDGLAPKFFAKKNAGAAPAAALIMTSVLATLLLFLNYSDGLVSAFTFLISISTLAVLAPYAITALAALSQRKGKGAAWTILAIVALVYSLVAIAGGGPGTLLWGAGLIAAGIPVYFLAKS